MNKTVTDFIIITHTQLNYNNYIIELKSNQSLGEINPGQFINILIKDSPSTFLRRPFSVHEVNYTNNSLFILVKEVGPGTIKIVNMKLGDSLDIVYPLGNGFSLPFKGEKILLVGGGVGIAPLMYLARKSKEVGAEVHILLGALSSVDHILIEEFRMYGEVYITTDDGTLGTKGFVVQHEIINNISGFKKIYCCGPEMMMQKVGSKAKLKNIECEISLENLMACGFGVCLCCVTKTKEGNKCVCSEGPVFNVNDLEWQI